MTTTDPEPPTIGARPRVGVVLSAGGISGYGFHVGALAALEAVTGWDPRRASVVLGTSSGSLVGLALVSGIGMAEHRDRVLATGEGAEADRLLAQLVGPASIRVPKVWTGPGAPRLVARQLARPRRIQVHKLAVGALPRGRMSTRPLREVAALFHPEGEPWPDDRLWVPATDVRSGVRTVFGRDLDSTEIDVADVVEASCAIPGLFAPVRIGRRFYVDGGMQSLDNADLLAPEPAFGPPVDPVVDIAVISSSVSLDGRRVGRRLPLRNQIQRFPRRALEANIRLLREAGVAVLVLHPGIRLVQTMGLNAMRPSKLRPIVEATERSLTRRLDQAEGGDRVILDALTALAGETTGGSDQLDGAGSTLEG